MATIYGMEELRIPGSPDIYRTGKIVCIGRNYARHALEMRAEVPAEPVVFLKPASAIIRSGSKIGLPRQSREVHHEVELVVLIGKTGRDIAPDRALEYVAGYAAGLDMTARDVQDAAKKAGLPWTVAKGFDTFAPLGDFSAAETVDPASLSIRLTINGRLVQDGTTADMIFPVEHLVAYCSSIFTLEPGDLIFTGTPEGVGPVQDGDELVASIRGLPELRVGVERAHQP